MKFNPLKLRIPKISNYIVFLMILSTVVTEMFLHQKIKKKKKPDETYRVGVVQYYPRVIKKAGSYTTIVNARNYVTIIEKAAEADIQIIVFPEYGLSGRPEDTYDSESLKIKKYPNFRPENFPFDKFSMNKMELREFRQSDPVMDLRKFYKSSGSFIPDLTMTKTHQVVPCDLESVHLPISTALAMISCAARDNRIYVVLNIFELYYCDFPCTEDDKLLFNANVVFDRYGVIVAHYRKFNTMLEPWIDQIYTPHESVFTTDFGVTFGQIIGIDLLKRNIINLYQQENQSVHNILLSTYPYDEMPFFSSKNDLDSYAFKWNKNLFVSGFSRDGSSGIFTNWTGWMQPSDYNLTKNMLLYADIPKIKSNNCCSTVEKIGMLNTISLVNETESVKNVNKSRKSSVLMKFEDDILEYIDFNSTTSKLLDLNQNYFEEELCFNDVCCYFEVRMETNPKVLKNGQFYRYRAMVLNGWYMFPDTTWFNFETCMILACAGDKVEDCGKNYNSLVKQNVTVFTFILITYQCHINEDSYFAPIVSTKLNGGRPLQINRDYWFSDKLYGIRFQQTNQHESNLLALFMIKPLTEMEVFGINGRIFSSKLPNNISGFNPIPQRVWLVISTTNCAYCIGILMTILCSFMAYLFFSQ